MQLKVLQKLKLFYSFIDQNVALDAQRECAEQAASVRAKS